jgi:nicotinamide phosphoribosyltransferase
MFDETVMFGLQYYLNEYLKGNVVTAEAIDEAEVIVASHLGSKDYFNRKGWEHILKKHDGHLPLRIRAVPEGTVVPTSNVLMTIENTDPECFWLTNYVETLLLKIWYPITVATLSREIKKKIAHYLSMTGTVAGIGYKLHDFGYRGVSSEETAAIGGAAHLVNFLGTDNVAALTLLKRYYSEPMAGYSIPAAEHSTITSWGQKEEGRAYANMLDKYPHGLVAVVSDSYDIYNACRNIWGDELKEKVLARNGTLIIRPDSGDPATVVKEVVCILAEKFGYELNGNGYKTLNPAVRVIQGDGVNYFSIQAILKTLAESGYSADNIAFGMGGALLQSVNRDTLSFAVKASSISIAGVDQDVFKKPATDNGKSSKSGRFSLIENNGQWATCRSPRMGINPSDRLQKVFENGKVLQTSTLAEIRDRVTL